MQTLGSVPILPSGRTKSDCLVQVLCSETATCSKAN
jgi:hypothetical protein